MTLGLQRQAALLASLPHNPRILLGLITDFCFFPPLVVRPLTPDHVALPMRSLFFWPHEKHWSKK